MSVFFVYGRSYPTYNYFYILLVCFVPGMSNSFTKKGKMVIWFDGLKVLRMERRKSVVTIKPSDLQTFLHFYSCDCGLRPTNRVWAENMTRTRKKLRNMQPTKQTKKLRYKLRARKLLPSIIAFALMVFTISSRAIDVFDYSLYIFSR